MPYPRERAWAILCEHTKGEPLRKHGLAVEAAMRHFAAKRGLGPDDVETWGITGLLHDFDYEARPEGHPQDGRPILEAAGLPPVVVRAIQSHGDHTGVTRETPMEKTLYACDELAGFVTAVALVRPSRRIADVTVNAVRRKMKDKAFARGVSREMMTAGAADLGVPLDVLIEEVITSLGGIAERLGLAPG